MPDKSSSIFGRLANEFTNSNTLFFNSQLSAEAIHKACHALGHSFRERIYSPAITMWMFIGQEREKVSGNVVWFNGRFAVVLKLPTKVPHHLRPPPWTPPFALKRLTLETAIHLHGKIDASDAL